MTLSEKIEYALDKDNPKPEISVIKAFKSALCFLFSKDIMAAIMVWFIPLTIAVIGLSYFFPEFGLQWFVLIFYLIAFLSLSALLSRHLLLEKPLPSLSYMFFKMMGERYQRRYILSFILIYLGLSLAMRTLTGPFIAVGIFPLIMASLIIVVLPVIYFVLPTIFVWLALIACQDHESQKNLLDQASALSRQIRWKLILVALVGSPLYFIPEFSQANIFIGLSCSFVNLLLEFIPFLMAIFLIKQHLNPRHQE